MTEEEFKKFEEDTREEIKEIVCVVMGMARKIAETKF